MKSVTLYFSTPAAAMFVCYCDFKPHLITFMQTGCAISADTLWVTVLQKTVSYLFQNTIPGFAYRPSKVTVNLLIFHIRSWVSRSQIYSWLIKYRNGKYSSFTHNTVFSHTFEAMFFTSKRKPCCFSYVPNWCCRLLCAITLCNYYTLNEYR
jgi:hypothetical protein